MKIIFATGDVKLHNTLHDLINQENQVIIDSDEVDYLDDLKELIWSKMPDMIFVSDRIATRSPIDNKGKFDAYLYNFIMDLKDWNLVFMVERPLQDSLIQKLFESEFYKIVPFTDPEKILALPTTREDVEKAFKSDNTYFPQSRSRVTDKAFIAPPSLEDSFDDSNSPYYPHAIQSIDRIVDYSKPTVSAFWSPIPNVGVGSFITALGNILARGGRRVLIIEMDWEYPKLARRTGLSHKDRTLKGALVRMLNGEKGINGFVVNNKVAEDDLPPTQRAIKQRLRNLPDTLFALSRNAQLHYEPAMELKDDRLIERLFFEAKQNGYHNILVDLPSSLSEFTLLSLLSADERFAVVDDSFATSGIFKMAMQAYKALEMTEEHFQLIVNKVQEDASAAEVSKFYDMTPIVTLPFDSEMVTAQLDLKIEYGKAYMQQVRSFAKRYGINVDETMMPKKKGLFIFN
ncbi:AAA family ATPase [Brevibacillus sp. NPDC003359]|uniref:AAA family ATPase n=1 Tax=unclassified Brevibacillus TaxID=2684853 RepID=UPI0036AD4411